jgi:hypothetical protein
MKASFAERSKPTFRLKGSIEGREQTFTRSLTRDGALRAKGVWRRINAGSNASIGVSHQNASLFIYRCIDEVEQIAIIPACGSTQAY